MRRQLLLPSSLSSRLRSSSSRSASATTSRRRWLGDEVDEFSGAIQEIADLLPTFRRQPLAIPSPDGSRSVVNWDRHLIVRAPRSASDDEQPIALVSPRYRLVQHAVVLAHAVRALEAENIRPEGLACHLLMTTRGERMALKIRLPDSYTLDPGDGHPMALRLELFNSVDGSMRFTAAVGWLRVVCSNGLVVSITGAKIGQRHDADLSVERIGDVLTEGLRRADEERESYSAWLQWPVSPEDVAEWIDRHVAPAWGKKASARAYHIIVTGRDGTFEDPFERAAPSARRMTPGRAVPGARAAAWNAYAISQALAWLARERGDVQEQLDWARDIPDLMRHLLN